MPVFVNRGEEVKAVNSADELEAAIGEGFGASSVAVRDPVSGKDITTSADKAVGFLRRGYTSPNLSEVFQGARDARIESQHGGIADTVQTYGERGLGVLTGGISDALASDERQREMRLRTEANPNAALAGEIVGGAAAIGAGGVGGVAKGVTALPAGAATRGAAALGERLAAKTGSKLLGAAATATGEGALFGVGQGVTELSLSADPVNAERIVSTLSEKVLYGGAIGGALGIFGKSAEIGLKKAGKAVGEYAERLKAGQQAAPEGGLAAQLKAYNAETAQDVYLAVDGAPAGRVGKARSRIAEITDTPRELENAPWSARRHLEKENIALREAIDNKDKFLASIAKDEERMATALDQRIKDRDGSTITLDEKETRKFVNWKNKLDPELGLKAKTGTEMTVGLDDAAAFRGALRNGEVASMRREAYERLPQILEQNERLYNVVQELADAKRSGRGIVGNVASNIASSAITGLSATAGAALGGPAGAMVGAQFGRELADRFTGMAAGRLGKAGADAATRVSGALSTFANTAAKSEPMARRGAFQVLSNTSFGPMTIPRGQAVAKQQLVAAYRERENELREQTQPGVDGNFEMRPGARERMAELLKPIQMRDPILADQMESVAARRATYLASKLPKRPEYGVMQLGQDSWRPSDMEIASFARSVQAVQDPAGVIERLNAGNVTVEDAEAFREVYPEWFEQVKLEVIEKLPEIAKGKLSYKKKLALTIFTGVPMDPSFHPQVLRVLQSQFEEPGTEDGTAPKAQPQFGSVNSKAFEPTPAQSRAG